MVLTGSGYVPLGQQPQAQKRFDGIAKYNHYHDERGRFTTADGVGERGAGKPPNSNQKPSVKPNIQEAVNFLRDNFLATTPFDLL